VFNLLEPDEQAILDLVIARNLGIEAAAETLGITSRMARTRCDKARARLAHKLRGWSDLIG
jgi:DNA-directed RNA polymerase specialized sigma24 family protein